MSGANGNDIVVNDETAIGSRDADGVKNRGCFVDLWGAGDKTLDHDAHGDCACQGLQSGPVFSTLSHRPFQDVSVPCYA